MTDLEYVQASDLLKEALKYPFLIQSFQLKSISFGVAGRLQQQDGQDERRLRFLQTGTVARRRKIQQFDRHGRHLPLERRSVRRTVGIHKGT